MPFERDARRDPYMLLCLAGMMKHGLSRRRNGHEKTRIETPRAIRWSHPMRVVGEAIDGETTAAGGEHFGKARLSGKHGLHGLVLRLRRCKRRAQKFARRIYCEQQAGFLEAFA